MPTDDSRSIFSTIPDALEDVRAGRMILVVDDEDRENEGDLVMAAEKVTPESINFMATNGRGLICLPLTGERLDELRIPPMSAENTSKEQTAFHVSIGAKHHITTGISAADRAATIRAAIDDATERSIAEQDQHDRLIPRRVHFTTQQAEGFVVRVARIRLCTGR